jgi:AraC-like DNA-binding protein
MRDERWTERDPAPRLWRQRRGGGRLHPVGSRAMLSNADRQPRGMCLLQYTVSGRLLVERGGIVTPCPAGCAALMWFGEVSAYGPDPAGGRYESRWLNLDGPGLLEAWSDLVTHGGGVVGPDRDGSLRRSIEAQIARRPPRDLRERLDLAAAVQRLVLDLYARSHAGGPGDVAAAVRTIVEDPCGCGTLAALARRHGCSREHLSRRFAAERGQSPQKFLRGQRLARARGLLQEGGMSVAEVARRSGWATARGLARALGQAPTRLRGPA